MTAIASTDAAPAARIAAVDIARGVAIVAMVVYHLNWDLAAHGITGLDVVEDPLWKGFARGIAGTFLALVGVSLVLATRNGFRVGPYFRRLAVIVAAAALVSFGTYWFVPWAFVFFGILHAIALFSVIGLPFVFVPPWVTAVAAAIAFGTPRFFTSAAFDAPVWWWLGLSEHPPNTVDYVPLFPWFGVVLLGIVGGRFIAANPGLFRWRPHDALSRALAVAGRWSLAIYLIHQPILLGLLFVIGPLFGPSEAMLANRYRAECDASCAADGNERDACAAFCGCMLEGLKAQGDLLAEAAKRELTNTERAIWLGHSEQCRAKTLLPPAGST